MEGVKEIHQERLPERIEELIVNAPIPHSVELIEDIPVPQEQFIAVEPAPPTENIAPAPAAPNSLPNQSLPPATPRCSTAELQILDLGFDMFGTSCEVIRIGTGPHFIGQIKVLYRWEKRGRFGLLDATQRLHFQRARCQAQEAFVRGGKTDFQKSDGIHTLKYIIHMCTLCSYQVLLCRH